MAIAKMGFGGGEDDGTSVPSSSPLLSSSFTAINTTPPTQILASGAATARASPARSPGRQRNAFVAEYLGLQNGPEPTTSQVTSTPPSTQPATAKRKRAPKAERSNIAAKRARRMRKRAPEDVTEQELTTRANHPKELSSVSEVNESQVSSKVPSQVNPLQTSITQPTQRIRVPARLSSSETLRGTSPPGHIAPKGSVYPEASSDNIETPPLNFGDSPRSNYKAPGTDDLLYNTGNEDSPAVRATSPPLEDQFDDGIDDDDLLTLTEEPRGSSDSVTNIIAHHTEPPNTQEDIVNVTVHASSANLNSPATIQAKLSTQSLGMKPIVRSPFPSQVRDRSPVIGLTASCLLRTCFRIGEAINVGRHAAKHGKSVLIELYARVLQSERTEERQTFTFGDLFHSKRPYLEAAYDAAIWKSVHLHEVDSRVFLSEGVKMCRCILATKSNGKEWIPTILNIWAAKKDDILWVEGIVNS